MAASANTPAASASPFGVSPSSATTITGTARMRSKVSTLGRLSGTISLERRYSRGVAVDYVYINKRRRKGPAGSPSKDGTEGGTEGSPRFSGWCPLRERRLHPKRRSHVQQ